MVDESVSVTVRLLGRSQSVSQSVSSSSVFNYVMLIAGKFYGMMLLQSFNILCGFCSHLIYCVVSERVCILLKTDFLTFYSF
jgi:hypothetical protein